MGSYSNSEDTLVSSPSSTSASNNWTWEPGGNWTPSSDGDDLMSNGTGYSNDEEVVDTFQTVSLACIGKYPVLSSQ
ncbi:unnamed protein product, partial [Orchesella dallaii]